MKALEVRCQGDRDLAAQLLEDRVVKQVVDRIEKREEEGVAGVRRRLLATSVRLTRGMASDLHEIVGQCRERLGVETDLELYVYSRSQLNAACVKPEGGRVFILFSSELLERFRGNELRFVVGHELGHHLYGHHDIPIGYLLKGGASPPPSVALRLVRMVSLR